TIADSAPTVTLSVVVGTSVVCPKLSDAANSMTAVRARSFFMVVGLLFWFSAYAEFFGSQLTLRLNSSRCTDGKGHGGVIRPRFVSGVVGQSPVDRGRASP